MCIIDYSNKEKTGEWDSKLRGGGRFASYGPGPGSSKPRLALTQG